MSNNPKEICTDSRLHDLVMIKLCMLRRNSALKLKIDSIKIALLTVVCYIFATLQQHG